MTSFGTLWVGNPMTKVQEISLSSFVYHGHDLTIFLYDTNIKVPPGVKKEDAREIMSEDRIFLVKDTYASFSDLFRYHMINKTGLVWVDADTICLRPDWNFKDNIFASEEEAKNKLFVVGGVLSLPKESDIIKYLIDEAEKIDKSDKSVLDWSTMGPELLTNTFKKFNYMEYVYPNYMFSGILPTQVKFLWRENKLDYIIDLCKNSYSLSIYNSTCVNLNIDRNKLNKNSAMEYFYNKFVNN